MILRTRPCKICGNRSTLDDIDALGFLRWSEFGDDIRQALPDLDEEKRWLVVSGIHIDCWKDKWASHE